MAKADPITRLNAALEGRYRVERELGEGGMATVYLAEDLKHERKVALKVLKPELAAVVGADRFLAEIKTTAKLQHPHILGLFDSGEADGLLFYAMPYVEGETLRDRLDREHQLPVDDAVRIATNLAEALDYAHRQGVIHRDIKPANVLLQDGKPVISDFGIALAVDAAGGGRLTETGLSLGTPHYMSPEQATGDLNVGPATDVYALGCVLYEMLVGEPPYTGSTPQAVLGKIIAGETPSAHAERSSVPPNVDAVIKKALEKLPADRFSSAGELDGALSDASFRHGGGQQPAPEDGRWKTAALVMTTITVVLAWFVLSLRGPRGGPEQDLDWSNLNPSPPLLVSNRGGSGIAVSPDGTLYAYVTGREGDPGSRNLWVRSRSQARATRATDLNVNLNPTFSPEGERILAVGGVPGEWGLISIPVDGSAPAALPTEGYDRMGHSWSDDGWIYMGSPEGVVRTPETGGPWALVTRVDSATGEAGHFSPVALPGARGVLFTVWRTPDYDTRLYDIAVASLEGSGHRILVSGVRAAFSPPDLMVHVSAAGGLFLSAFDLGRLEVRGRPTPIADNVSVGLLGTLDLTVSHTGRLVYGALPDQLPTSELVLVSRNGQARSVDPTYLGDFRHVSVSNGGSRLAVERRVGRMGTGGVVVKSLERGTTVPISTGVWGSRPTWSPDDTHVEFNSPQGQNFGRWRARVDGSAGPELLIRNAEGVAEGRWSTDGRWLFYRLDGGDIWVREGDSGEDRPILASNHWELTPSLSSDGRRIAYASDETGIWEVWVATFSDAGRVGGRQKVSEGGGSEPLWSRSGRELFYRDRNDDLVVVEFDANEELSFSGPRRLFSANPYLSDVYSRPYDVMPGDSTFVMIRVTDPGAVSELVIIEGFPNLLER